MFKDVAQTERLLRAIYRPQNVYCVHVDRKSSAEVLRGMASVVKCLPNVFMTIRRYDVQWGRWSVLEPELEVNKWAALPGGHYWNYQLVHHHLVKSLWVGSWGSISWVEAIFDHMGGYFNISKCHQPGMFQYSHLFEFGVMCCMLSTSHVSSRIVANISESSLLLS